MIPDALADAIAILASRTNVPKMASGLTAVNLTNKTPFDKL